METDRYTSNIEILLDVFETRFSEFAAEENNVALFTNPFTFPEENIASLNVNIQLELIDLKNNSVLKGRFNETPPVPTTQCS